MLSYHDAVVSVLLFENIFAWIVTTMDGEIKYDKWGDIWCTFRRIPICDRIIIVCQMIIERNWHISYYRITNERKVDKIDAIS